MKKKKSKNRRKKTPKTIQFISGKCPYCKQIIVFHPGQRGKKFYKARIGGFTRKEPYEKKPTYLDYPI